MPKPRKGIEKIRCYGFASAREYSDEPTVLWAVRQDNMGDIAEDADVVSGVADTVFQTRRPMTEVRVPKANWLLVDQHGYKYNIVSVVVDTYRPRSHILIRARAAK